MVTKLDLLVDRIGVHPRHEPVNTCAENPQLTAKVRRRVVDVLLDVFEYRPRIPHDRRVNIPIIAAGGARTAEDVERLIEWGANSVACGSAFLLADEAGTSATNRDVLRAGGTSVSTRAFSGRYARGVETRFTREHDDLPPLYPQLNAMQKPLRSNPDHGYCLVGEDFAGALHEGPAAEIEAKLLGR